METIPITDQEYRASDLTGVLRHDDPALVEIVRVRYLSDPGFPLWDLSYAWGLDEGSNLVRVTPPPAAYQIPKQRPATSLIARWPDLPKKVKGGFVRDILSLNV